MFNLKIGLHASINPARVTVLFMRKKDGNSNHDSIALALYDDDMCPLSIFTHWIFIAVRLEYCGGKQPIKSGIMV